MFFTSQTVLPRYPHCSCGRAVTAARVMEVRSTAVVSRVVGTCIVGSAGRVVPANNKLQVRRSHLSMQAHAQFFFSKLMIIRDSKISGGSGYTSPIYMEYQYLVQSSLTFSSITFLKLIHYQKLPPVEPFMQTMFNSSSMAHLIISSSSKYM